MATAEFAVAIPVLVLVLVLALSAVRAAMDQVRCIDAARATARSLARGDSDAAALDLGRPLAPPGAEFALGGTADVVEVSVRHDARRAQGGSAGREPGKPAARRSRPSVASGCS
jgi:hypothetical protein